MTFPALRRILLPAVVLIILVIAAIAPIRSYDYYWHVATGRWIVEHLALPATDPFAVASDRTPWVDGEWLFQLLVYPVQAAVGDSGVSIARGVFVGGLFFLLFLASRRWAGDGIALLLTGLAFMAGTDRFDVRPSTVAAALAAAAVWLLGRRSSARRDLAYALLTVVWINVHPSALLAPLLALIAGLLQRTVAAEEERVRRSVPDEEHGVRDRRRSNRLRRLRPFFAATLALLFNPYGIEGIAAPLGLAAFAGGGAFTNAEWLPSLPSTFPLLYIMIAVALVSWGFSPERTRSLWRAGLFCLLAVLAVRFVRNQGLFLACYPLLAAPWIPTPRRRWMRDAAVVAGALLMGVAAVNSDHTPGPDASRFPVNAVDAFSRHDRGGHIYNPDQFGGYLIWRLYPERRVLTDGRNELYHRFIAEYAEARLDGRKWNALLEKYAIAVAIDEYHREHIDVVEARTGVHRQLPASRIYFPRNKWALIAFDDVGMVFVRRAGWPASLLARFEYRVLVPDDPGGALQGAGTRQMAEMEITRARRELGELRVIRRMEAALAAR